MQSSIRMDNINENMAEAERHFMKIIIIESHLVIRKLKRTHQYTEYAPGSALYVIKYAISMFDFRKLIL
jgi:hypothetical protein